MKAKKSKSMPWVQKKGLLVVTGLAGLLALGLGSMLYAQDSKKASLLRPDDTRLVALGQEIYAEQCAACHGDNLQGQPNWREPNENGRLPAPPHDATGHTWHHADELLFGVTKFGLAEFANLKDYDSDMPPYKDVLSDEEIIAVLSYIKSTWPDQIRDIHDQRNAIK